MSGSSGAPVLTTFSSGDIVISVYGDGDGSGTYTDNQAAPIVLEELTTGGTEVGQMTLPETTSIVNGVTEYGISGEYGSSSEGSLELSGDGKSLVIAGYAVNYATYNAGESNGNNIYGNAAEAQSTSIKGGQYTAVARAVADIGYNGTVDTSTALYNVFNTNNPRSVATVDGSSFYISGQGVSGDTTQGLFYAADGASSATAIDNSTDTRTVEIYNGEVYASRDSKQAAGTTNKFTANISSYGGEPTTATTPSILAGISQSVKLTAATENTVNSSAVGTNVDLSPENFFFANATTLYVADGGNPKGNTSKNPSLGDGGLQKWVYNGSTWTLAYTLSAGLNLVQNTASSGTTGLIGLTGVVNADGTVTLYTTNATLGDLDQTYLYTITDTLSATTAASGESFTVLETAAADTNIRGVALAPSNACFVAGVRIAVPGGEVSVESLNAGRKILLHDGGTADVIWLGYRTIDLSRHANPQTVQPVVIEAGALGDGVPRRDLYVSPDHALYLNGHLIPAKALMNGFSIRQVNWRSVTYYHVELARHGVLLAEGAAAESYLETGNRGAFENAELPVHLHPDFAQALRTRLGCAPFAETGDVVKTVRQGILDRCGLAMTNDPALVIRSSKDGAVIVSHSAVPGLISADPRDRRRLGVKIGRLEVGGAIVAMDHPALRQGWHDMEPDGRWTDGHAVIPASIIAELGQDVRVSVVGTLNYPCSAGGNISAVG